MAGGPPARGRPLRTTMSADRTDLTVAFPDIAKIKRGRDGENEEEDKDESESGTGGLRRR